MMVGLQSIRPFMASQHADGPGKIIPEIHEDACEFWSSRGILP